MKTLLRTTGFLLLTMGFAAAAYADASLGIGHLFNGWGHGVSGSGTLRSESRDIGRFDSIDVRDSTDVEVRVGSATSLRIEADDNILSLISTRVSSGTLIIESTGSYHTRLSPKIVLTTPSLKRLSINGSSDVKLNDLSGDEIALLISGSGDILANGDVGNLDLSIDGSGDADLVALTTGAARVTINGSGDVKLGDVKRLKAEVNGSGDISYAGNPDKLTSRVNGSGEISRR